MIDLTLKFQGFHGTGFDRLIESYVGESTGSGYCFITNGRDLIIPFKRKGDAVRAIELMLSNKDLLDFVGYEVWTR